MNDAGMVAGKMYVENGYRCFTWKDGKIESLPEDITDVYAINTKGTLAVRSKKGVGTWSNGKFELAKEPFRYAQVAGIDDNGRMIGHVATGTEGMYATVDSTESMKYPMAPRPQAVAPDGAFVGTHLLGLQNFRSTKPIGWLWKDGKETGVGDADIHAFPMCISRNHTIGGYFQRGDNRYRQPFSWYQGKLTELSLPTGNVDESHSSGTLVSINDKGEAVGTGDWQERLTNGIANRHLALCWKDGRVYTIEDLIPKEAKLEFSEAYAINNKGQILVQIAPVDTHWPRSLALLTPK